MPYRVLLQSSVMDLGHACAGSIVNNIGYAAYGNCSQTQIEAAAMVAIAAGGNSILH